MTQISGKKYQMKNAAGTVNRFPYTVMEAVLGLNSYLQDQFSALADIYMPIEGITESKTGQEFVYRKSPATIKAKSLTLDRIYGKTLAWNQLVSSLYLESGVYEGLTVTNNGDGTYTFNGTTTGLFDHRVANVDVLAGHKYFVRLDVPNVEANFAQASFTLDANGRAITTPASDKNRLYITMGSGVTLNNVRVTPQVTDLTLLYGSEIDGMTDAEILAKFESEFPGYHDFGNKLISNDAESLETTGFNQWDEEWEESDGRVLTKNYIPVITGKTYYLRIGELTNSAQFTIWYYDAAKNQIGADYPTATSTLTIPDGVFYIKALFPAAYGTPYNHDICINLSDPAKNGTYEPYRKTTLQLGLNNFKVKDGNGNITTITGGLKSAGDVHDEIVGNKYIKRMNRVNLEDLPWAGRDSYARFFAPIPDIKMAAAPNVAGNIVCSKYQNVMIDNVHLTNMSVGVNDNTAYIYLRDDSLSGPSAITGYLDYELATPIEYELVEPLVYSMAAGTTEERISPNSDGLSAPFCCDMTYYANANNDSANAQYALTAGRLYNTHKLWGRDFDGSNDVSGALSGVTTIEASGNITTVAQLISTVATGTAPLSVASTTEVANLHSYTATKLHTQRTLWGQNFDGSGNVTGDMSSVGNIAFSASGKNIASLLYFDTTNSRVGVGASSPAYKLDVNGTLNASGNTTLGGTLGVTGNSTLDGTVRIGGSSGATLTYVSANSGLSIDKGLYSSSYLTAGAASASSDERLKTNIIDFGEAISMLLLIKPREWDWNDKTPLEGHCAGFVAQEVQSIIPYAVEKHGEYLSLNYNVFHALEVSALQNHERRLAMLERENQRLRDGIANLKK